MKPAFPVYHDDVEDLEDLTDEQFGRLIRAVCEHSKGGDVTPGADIVSAYKIMIRKVDRDAEKYAARCEQNRLNASKRERTQANASERKRRKPTETETETETKTERVIKAVPSYSQRDDDMEGVLMNL